MNKLRMVWQLLRSYSYVVLTDSNAVIHIPMMDIEKIQNVMILGSQTSSLKEFRDRLDEVIKEHDHQTKLLLHRRRNAYKRDKV